MYLGCNKKGCNFFQWTNVALTQKNRDWIEAILAPQRQKYKFPDAFPRPMREYAGRNLLWDQAKEAVQKIMVIHLSA